MRYLAMLLICVCVSGCVRDTENIKNSVPISKEKAIGIAIQYVRDNKLEDKYILSEVNRQEQIYHYGVVVTQNTNTSADHIGFMIKSNGEIFTGKELYGEDPFNLLGFPRKPIHSESEAEKYLLEALKNYNSKYLYSIEYKDTIPSGWCIKFQGVKSNNFNKFGGTGRWFDLLLTEEGRIADVVRGK